MGKFPEKNFQNREKEANRYIMFWNWRYAKRQLTWFKKYNPQAHWIKDYKEAEKLVKNFLKN